MISINNVKVSGFEEAVRGMRNSMNSWDKSDSNFGTSVDFLGLNDLDLMYKLAKAGDSHSKFMRFIDVTIDITAPLYWWKEFDTYKVGTVASSCSTMHTIHSKEFELDDFSYEHLSRIGVNVLCENIGMLNEYRYWYNQYDENPDDAKKALGAYSKKDLWWGMIQLLPSSYNQKRTVKLNYTVLARIYNDRHDHRLDEWHDFCTWINNLPYNKLIFADRS